VITLKLATSLDGRIATAAGESRWITGPQAREQVHKLRAMHNAVLVGVETAIADDPELTVRLQGYVGPQPTRVVLDSKQRLPINSKLVREAYRLDTVVVSVERAKERLTKAGVQVLTVAAKEGRPDPANIEGMLAAWAHAKLLALEKTTPRDDPKAFAQALNKLIENRDSPAGDIPAAADFSDSPPFNLLIEGGGQVAASFLAAGLVDKIEWFRAPIILGDEGRPAVGEFVLNRLKDAPRFKRIEVSSVGDDQWERYERL
jgi:diaminohydroxyphosphoribosylaminopyrimidine deaminase/5-amino-6-(5-phosphoribosylamino)uracil reductase